MLKHADTSWAVLTWQSLMLVAMHFTSGTHLSTCFLSARGTDSNMRCPALSPSVLGWMARRIARNMSDSRTQLSWQSRCTGRQTKGMMWSLRVTINDNDK